MNPPSALQSAMGRERKPFSYLPGGLDLSQIKSERMAQRLMRNAMNQGVPEVPAHQIQSPPTPSTPVAVPNFSCLPVQVIPPGFTLPANPKSLLRSRSNPDRNRATSQIATKAPPSANPQTISQTRINHLQNNVTLAPHVNNNKYNNRPTSMFDYGYTPDSNAMSKTNYGSGGITTPSLPEICYDVEYLIVEPKNYDKTGNKRLSMPAYTEQAGSFPDCFNNANVDPTARLFDKNANLSSYEPAQTTTAECYSSDVHKEPSCAEIRYNAEPLHIDPITFDNRDVKVPIDVNKNNVISSEKKTEDNVMFESKGASKTDFTIALSVADDNVTTFEPVKIKSAEEIMESSDEQKQVKVVKKQVKKERKVEESVNNVEKQNGEQNGDVETELVVKLPAKKTGTKTETKVEVLKKSLPDGSIEEITKTTTKTTTDGNTSIKTKTETRIIPKEEVSEEEVEEEEEEEEEEEHTEKQTVGKPGVVVVKEKEQNVVVTKEESKAATTTTNKIVVECNEQESEEEEEEVVEPIKEQKKTEKEIPKTEVKKVEEAQQAEEEEVEEDEEEKEVVVQKTVTIPTEETTQVMAKDKEEEVEDEEEAEEDEVIVKTDVERKSDEVSKKEEEEVDDEEEYEEAENVEVEIKKSAPQPEPNPEPKIVEESKEDEESEYTEEEIESENDEPLTPAPIEKPQVKTESEDHEPKEEKPEPKEQKTEQPVTVKLEQKVPLREPSIPLEKVEDVEIKPIGVTESITKSHTQNTEIITNPAAPPGTLSTQTEYNRIENIVTVNRTTKTLDNTYEQITQSGIPTMKTYFAPNRERVSTSPQPSKPYQPVYTPETPKTERRHSLLLDRLSTERQIPVSDVYQNSYSNQYSNQSYEQQKQWSQEPQSEIVHVSNVKPSTITNSQWYQQNRSENVLYNNVTPSTAPLASQWNQPQEPQPHYQPSYTQSTQDYSKLSSNTYQQNSYPSYTPKPSSWGNTNLSDVDTIPSINVQANQYANRSQETNNYHNSSQQYSSSYVPPPWEQDPNYVAPATSNFFQPRSNNPQQPPATNIFSPNTRSGWKPTPQTKFSKPPPTAYVPPAPNQSFVKNVNVAEPPPQIGRKTYYSEYERRYITVPESNYVPGETKFQAQPDASPQYYYDNNEQPAEQVEPQWRKELREFTEKTSQTQYHTQQTSVNPPWETEASYVKNTNVKYTPTPSWSQTLRPQSWRERSFESELVSESQEYAKSNTLGRPRPVSSYVKAAEAPIPERTRGVSVDRYNPNSYSGPIQSEHPPVQAQTLTVATAPHSKGYHNPNVPAYHSRASAEPREQPAYHHPRGYAPDSRASPLQSRSFKYLQWITGTEQ